MTPEFPLPDLVTEIPGPKSRSMADRLREVESPDATCLADNFPVFWAEARGSNIWDVDGNRYLDLIAGFGAAALGHAHPGVVEAVRLQSGRLIHGMGDVHPTDIRLELSEKLVSLAPGGGEWKCIYGLNGSDAVEAALKTAALATERSGVIRFEGGYHGLSLGALSVTGGERFREGLEDLIRPNAAVFPYPGFLDETKEEARQLLKEMQDFLDSDEGQDIGAVIVEPLAGRGGVVAPPSGFLSGLRKMCDRNKLVLIFDEIFTGMGRTGRWFACEHEDVVPDLLLIGKALGGGVPLSVCLGQADVIDAWEDSRGEAKHTSTFVGHPLGCAAALAVVHTIQNENLVPEVALKGSALLEQLQNTFEGLPQVGAVRGRGLMLGIEILNPDTGESDGEEAWRLVVEGLSRGLILLVSGPGANILQWTPSYLIGESQTGFAIDTLSELMRSHR